jgi:hypothetical protein
MRAHEPGRERIARCQHAGDRRGEGRKARAEPIAVAGVEAQKAEAPEIGGPPEVSAARRARKGGASRSERRKTGTRRRCRESDPHRDLQRPKGRSTKRFTSGLIERPSPDVDQGGERGRELRKEQRVVTTKEHAEERSHEVDAVMVVARRS